MHKEASFTDALYFMRPISQLWQEQGHTVTVLQGPDKFVDGDIAILHVDLTVVPDDYIHFVRRYPKSINAGVKDISKRCFSTNQVALGDGYDGAVIVKTDRNCGGSGESVVTRNHSFVGRCTHAVRRRLHWTLSGEMVSGNYPVFDSVNDVPRRVWSNSRLIVEKFLPERLGEFYCLRTWVFLADCESSSMCTAHRPVVKGADFIERIPVDVPDELRQMRKDFDFDFGKFDYVMIDGRVVLYDVNRTPTLGDTPADMYMPRARVLAEGLKAFL